MIVRVILEYQRDRSVGVSGWFDLAIRTMRCCRPDNKGRSDLWRVTLRRSAPAVCSSLIAAQLCSEENLPQLRWERFRLRRSASSAAIRVEEMVSRRGESARRAEPPR